MTPKAPEPYESHDDARSFFDELIGQGASSRAASSQFSFNSLSGNSVLDMFRNETNAMLKGAVAKIKLDETSVAQKSFELRLSSWQDRLDVAMDRIDEQILVLSNVQAPQKREGERRDIQEGRPVAFALLKALKSGIMQQSQEVASVQRALIAGQLHAQHSELVQQLLHFLQSCTDHDQVASKLDHFFRVLFFSFRDAHGQKGFQGLALFIKDIQKQVPTSWQTLFEEQFLHAFEDIEQSSASFIGSGAKDFSKLLLLHEALASSIAPNEPGIAATLQDDSGIILHYFRGLSSLEGKTAMGPHVAMPQNALSIQYTALLAALFVDEGHVLLEDCITNLLPELRQSQFLFEGLPQKITFRDLLFMKSALPDLKALALLSGKEFHRMSDAEKFELLQKNSQLSFHPGSETKAFSDTNLWLLAKIMERRSGSSFQELAKQKLFGQEALFLLETTFEKCSDQKVIADGFTYNKHSGIWEVVPSKNETLQLFSTPHDLVIWNQNLLSNRLGKDPKAVEKLVQQSLQVDDELLITYGFTSGFTLLFMGLPRQSDGRFFSISMQSNREGFSLERKAKELVETLSPVPVYGLAFMPFSLDSQALDEVEKVGESDAVETLLKRFEGMYRSEALGVSWKLVASKKLVPTLSKEYWGLEVFIQEGESSESLFCVPVELSDDAALFLLDNRPQCRLHFSRNQFVVHDPESAIVDLLFEKTS